ncbi:DUF998 domain-containing protein [Candidatus Dojkabacteria bacterium]|nr:DUF998 domain-containing protein [Candidatus Dojkabacteria bacterium]
MAVSKRKNRIKCRSLGVIAGIIALAATIISILFYEEFSIFNDNLSTLGNYSVSKAAPIFNLGLLTSSILNFAFIKQAKSDLLGNPKQTKIMKFLLLSSSVGLALTGLVPTSDNLLLKNSHRLFGYGSVLIYLTGSLYLGYILYKKRDRFFTIHAFCILAPLVVLAFFAEDRSRWGIPETSGLMSLTIWNTAATRRLYPRLQTL